MFIFDIFMFIFFWILSNVYHKLCSEVILTFSQGHDQCSAYCLDVVNLLSKIIWKLLQGLKGYWVETRYNYMTFEPKVWPWPWQHLSYGLYIISIRQIIWKSRIDSLLSGHKILTSEPMVQPWPWTNVNNSLTLHIISMWWTVLLSYLKIPPGNEVLQKGHEFVTNRTDRYAHLR